MPSRSNTLEVIITVAILITPTLMPTHDARSYLLLVLTHHTGHQIFATLSLNFCQIFFRRIFDLDQNCRSTSTSFEVGVFRAASIVSLALSLTSVMTGN